MKLGDFRKRTQDLGDDVVLAVAEQDEMGAMNIAEVEIVDDAKVRDRKATGHEAVDLGEGKQRAVVLRF